jgi:hypothetical protein
MPSGERPRKTKRVGKAVTSVTGGGRGRPPGSDRKQDWIASQLRRVYDEALQEAIPDDMLQLLEQLDAPETTDQTEARGDET